MSDPAGICKGCNTSFPRLDAPHCGLCIKVNEIISRGSTDTLVTETINRIRSRKLQCMSCSLVYLNSDKAVDVCLECIGHWDKHPPPPDILVRLVNQRRAGTAPGAPARLPEPPSLHGARAQRLSSDDPLHSYQNSLLATEADLHRQSASNYRLHTVKPTTQTTSRKFSSMNADTYKASKNQVAHFQKTQAAVGGNMTFLAALWKEMDNSASPRQISDRQVQRTPGVSALALDVLEDIVAALVKENSNTMGGCPQTLTLADMRIEAFIKNKHHPVVTFHNNYDYSTPLERFWEDLCRNNMTKPMPSGSGSRMVELRFVYQGCIDSDDEFIELSDQNELRTGLASRKRMYSAIDGGNSSDARSGLGSLFSISAFRPPIPPRTPSPPQSPRLSYSTFEGSMEEWNVQIIRAAVNSEGLPSLTEWEDTTLSFSTYLRENKWAAAYPLKRPEDSVLKDGQGLLGVGGSKVAIFGMHNGVKYAVSLQRSGWTASGKSAMTPESHVTFRQELENELKLLAQGDYFVTAFEQRIQQARQGGYLDSIPELRFAHKESFVGKIVKPASADDHAAFGIDGSPTAYTAILPQPYFLATPLIGHAADKPIHFTAHDPRDDPQGPPTSPDLNVFYTRFWKTVQAFSHFVYEYSKHTMILVDLQGIVDVDGVLTLFDPQAHTDFNTGIKRPYYDRGADFIMHFINVHNCNIYCSKLGLECLRRREPVPTLKAKQSRAKKGTPGTRASARQQAAAAAAAAAAPSGSHQ